MTVLKPEIDFWEYVAYAGFPLKKALWCRRLLKMAPIKKFLKSIHGWKVQVLGIRRRESHLRMKSPFYRYPLRRHTKLPYTYELLPILEWTKRQVDNYLKKHKILTNPCYKYYRTSGCYFCPFVTNKMHYLNLKARHPDLFQKIVYAETHLRKNHSALFSHERIYVSEIAKQQQLLLED